MPNFLAASLCPLLAPLRCSSGKGAGIGHTLLSGALSWARPALTENQIKESLELLRPRQVKSEFQSSYPVRELAPAPGGRGADFAAPFASSNLWWSPPPEAAFCLFPSCLCLSLVGLCHLRLCQCSLDRFCWRRSSAFSCFPGTSLWI